MIKVFLLVLFFSVLLNAEITLNYLDTKPQSRSKDFMIWQYLNQDISPSQANAAYKQVKSVDSYKIFYRYAKKTNNKNAKEKLRCKRSKNLLSIKNKECLELAYTPKKSLNYSNKQRKQLIAKLSNKNLICMLNLQNEPHTQKAYENYSADSFLSFFNQVGYRYRNKKLNIHLNDKFLDNLSCSTKVSQFIKTIVNTRQLNKLQISLLNANGEFLDSTSNFFLAINHLNYNNKLQAIKFFSLSKEKALKALDKDKNLFWLYKVSKDDKYLISLLKSTDINIYTLYAHDKKNISTKNYFFKMNTDTSKRYSINLNDPFEWDEIYSEIKDTPKNTLLKLVSKYNQKNMTPVQAYIIQKASQYRMHGYTMPYDEYLRGLSLDDKAMMYAVMRQESQMIPSALSHSFALGLMQMMPFVTKAISKEIKKPIKNLNDMFEPENNIRYARHHLRWMKRSLYHPLFIAYAYNGGMGFFKSYLLSGKFSKGEYEPFLSMEMMSNTESREYGKKVLANYVMYKKILNDEISIIDLFDKLLKPKMTDRFRVSK